MSDIKTIINCQMQKWHFPHIRYKKSPQIVALRPPMHRTIFGTANIMRIHRLFWCICTYCVHNVVRSGKIGGWKVGANNRKLTRDFTTPIDSKYCSICHRLAVIWKWFWDQQFWQLGESVMGSAAEPIKSPPTTSQYLLIQSFALPPFCRNSNVKFWAPIRPPFGG